MSFSSQSAYVLTNLSRKVTSSAPMHCSHELDADSICKMERKKLIKTSLWNQKLKFEKGRVVSALIFNQIAGIKVNFHARGWQEFFLCLQMLLSINSLTCSQGTSMRRGKHLCNVHIHIVGPSLIHLPLNLSFNQVWLVPWSKDLVLLKISKGGTTNVLRLWGFKSTFTPMELKSNFVLRWPLYSMKVDLCQGLWTWIETTRLRNLATLNTEIRSYQKPQN